MQPRQMRETFIPAEPRLVYSIEGLSSAILYNMQDAVGPRVDSCFMKTRLLHFNLLKSHPQQQTGHSGTGIVASVGHDPAKRRFLQQLTFSFLADL